MMNDYGGWFQARGTITCPPSGMRADIGPDPGTDSNLINQNQLAPAVPSDFQHQYSDPTAGPFAQYSASPWQSQAVQSGIVGNDANYHGHSAYSDQTSLYQSAPCPCPAGPLVGHHSSPHQSYNHTSSHQDYYGLAANSGHRYLPYAQAPTPRQPGSTAYVSTAGTVPLVEYPPPGYSVFTSHTNPSAPGQTQHTALLPPGPFQHSNSAERQRSNTLTSATLDGAQYRGLSFHSAPPPTGVSFSQNNPFAAANPPLPSDSSDQTLHNGQQVNSGPPVQDSHSQTPPDQYTTPREHFTEEEILNSLIEFNCFGSQFEDSPAENSGNNSNNVLNNNQGGTATLEQAAAPLDVDQNVEILLDQPHPTLDQPEPPLSYPDPFVPGHPLHAPGSTLQYPDPSFPCNPGFTQSGPQFSWVPNFNQSITTTPPQFPVPANNAHQFQPSLGQTIVVNTLTSGAQQSVEGQATATKRRKPRQSRKTAQPRGYKRKSLRNNGPIPVTGKVSSMERVVQAGGPVRSKYILPPPPPPGRKPKAATTITSKEDKRKAQNRDAQRQFRERKAQAAKENEGKCGRQAIEINNLNAEVARLNEVQRSLESDLQTERQLRAEVTRQRDHWIERFNQQQHRVDSAVGSPNGEPMVKQSSSASNTLSPDAAHSAQSPQEQGPAGATPQPSLSLRSSESMTNGDGAAAAISAPIARNCGDCTSRTCVCLNEWVNTEADGDNSRPAVSNTQQPYIDYAIDLTAKYAKPTAPPPTLRSSTTAPQSIRPAPGTCDRCQSDPAQRAFCLGLANKRAENSSNDENGRPTKLPRIDNLFAAAASSPAGNTIPCRDVYPLYKRITSSVPENSAITQDTIRNVAQDLPAPESRDKRQASALDVNYAEILATLKFGNLK